MQEVCQRFGRFLQIQKRNHRERLQVATETPNLKNRNRQRIY
jgi:hypothetical protein